MIPADVTKHSAIDPIVSNGDSGIKWAAGQTEGWPVAAILPSRISKSCRPVGVRPAGLSCD